jgi:hypothetical protein
VFFESQQVDDLVRAIQRSDAMKFDPARIRAHAASFDTAVFRQRWRDLFVRLGVDPSLYSGA